MDTMLAWISAALFGLFLLSGLAALFLMRRLKAIILEVYRRMEAVTGEVAKVRHEVAGVRHEVADVGYRLQAQLRDEGGGVRLVAAALSDIAAGIERTYVPMRIANVLANEHVIAHLAALRDDAVPPGGMSYAFRRAVDALSPVVLRRGDGRTAICSVALGEAYFGKVRPALASQQYFAEKHGLSYAILTEPPSYSERPPAWMKIPLIMALFEQGFERVAYIDADALVTRLDFDVGAVFGGPSPNGSLCLTEDEAGINCGVMFLQDGPAIRRLLDLIWLFDADVKNGTWEQFALKCLMDHSPAVARHVTIEPDPRRFNSFPVERNRFYRTMEKSTWRPGDFICHISGIRSPHLEALMEDYATRIAPLPYYGRAA